MALPDHASQPQIRQLAADHQLHLDEASIRFNELGLDFRFALATGSDGHNWVVGLAHPYR